MTRMKSHEIEAILADVLEKSTPIPFKTFSNMVYIIESLFRQEKLHIPIKYQYSNEGMISEDLKYFLKRLSNQECVKITYESPSILSMGSKCFENKNEEFYQQYASTIEKMNSFLKAKELSEISDEQIKNLALLVRINNIMKIGQIRRDDLGHRILFDKIDMDSINEIRQYIDIESIIPPI